MIITTKEKKKPPSIPDVLFGLVVLVV